MSKPHRPPNQSRRGLHPGPDNDIRRLKYIKTIGPMSVKRVDEGDVPYRSYCMVLVGPTGSGKSSFIEALNRTGSNPPLHIAKDQLDGVTQQVTAYHLEGVTSYGVPVYLIDTPGFSDPNISEMEILTGMKIWRAKSDGTTPKFEAAYVRVIYMCPITDTRLAGRRRNYLSMIQNFWGDRNKYRARLVTTMWDRLIEGSESQLKALERFKGLDEHWKDLWDGGSGSSYVLKFHNSHESAMDVLNRVCRTVLARSEREPSDPVEGLGLTSEVTDKTLLPVYKTLEERIESLQQRLRFIEGELRDPSTMQYPELVGLLEKEREECVMHLEKFVREMAEYLCVEPEAVIQRMVSTSQPPPYLNALLDKGTAEFGVSADDIKVNIPSEELQPSSQPQDHSIASPAALTASEILKAQQRFLTASPIAHESTSIQTMTGQQLSKGPRVLSLYRGLATWFKAKFRFKRHSTRAQR